MNNRNPFQQNEEEAFSSYQSQTVTPQKTTTFFNSKLVTQRSSMEPSISIYDKEYFVIRDGVVFKKLNNDLIHHNQFNTLGFIVFVLPLDPEVGRYLVANINFELFVVEDTSSKKLAFTGINRQPFLLSTHDIYAWSISNNKRNLAMLCRGTTSDYLLMVDFAYYQIVQIRVPVNNLYTILWSNNDRYLGLHNTSKAVIMESILWEYQIITIQESIKQIEFQQDKFVIFVNNLSLYVYRRADWVQKDNPNIIKRLLFPQMQQSQSRVQFYLMVKISGQNGIQTDQMVVRIVKVKDIIKRILLFTQNSLFQAVLNNLEQNRLDFQLVQENISMEYDDIDIHPEVEDIKVQVISETDQQFSKINCNVLQLHKVNQSNVYLNTKKLLL